MKRIYDFILSNLITIGLIYLIGAGIAFVGVLLFFWWICKAENKERELYPDDDFYYGEEAGTETTMIIGLPVAMGCAILWWGIPILFLGVWMFDKMARKFPTLMGGMADDTEKFDEEENK